MNTGLRQHAKSMQHIVDSADADIPPLPLTHSMGSSEFFDIIDDGVIKTTECKVYDDNLLYLFYGRPAYRPFPTVMSTSNSVFRPVCILLKPESAKYAHRIMPLDSGAFHAGMFSKYCANLEKTDFEIAGPNAAQKFVSAFFGSNKDYYLSKIKTDLKIGATELVAGAYRSIQSTSGETELDDRRSTIELQFQIDITLDSNTVMAVCLPEEYLEDPDLLKKIKSDWKADTIEYDIYHDRPDHDVREMMTRVKIYLTNKGLI